VLLGLLCAAIGILIAATISVVRNELDVIDVAELCEVGFDLGGGGLEVDVRDEELVGVVEWG